MSKYVVSDTTVYRVGTVAEVEQLHDELLADSSFTLGAFSYKTKYIKAKGEIIDEYQLVSAKKIFNEEKEPTNPVEITYNVKEFEATF